MFWYEFLGANKLKDKDILDTVEGDFVLQGDILRQAELYSNNQQQTKEAFGFKWEKRDTYESEAIKNNAKKWLYERYLGGNEYLLEKYLPNGARLLDAGCGAGFSALLLFEQRLNHIHYLGADISSSVDIAKTRFAEKKSSGEFIQANLVKLPFDKPIFDVIFSEGVLHHTDSTELSVKYLSKLLVQGGYFMFYVYRQKGPIREFTDDFIREYLKSRSDQEAWDALLPLTKLGKALGDLNIEIDVPESIEYLGIPKGKINLQRLFYWHFCKAFYQPEWNSEETNHVNFDWYRPMNCQRHTSEELRLWCEEANLQIEHMDIQEAGITIVARKTR
jgi:arsenite methyltransferase